MIERLFKACRELESQQLDEPANGTVALEAFLDSARKLGIRSNNLDLEYLLECGVLFVDYRKFLSAVFGAEAVSTLNDNAEFSVTVSRMNGEATAVGSLSPHDTLSRLQKAVEEAWMLRAEGRAALVMGTYRFTAQDEESTLQSLGIGEGSALQCFVEKASYAVSGAGLQHVNGAYVQREELVDGVASYANGDVVLLRYRMASGNRFWYFTRLSEDVHKAAGDLYRVRGEAEEPPLEGWKCDKSCPDGVEPVPVLCNVGNC